MLLPGTVVRVKFSSCQEQEIHARLEETEDFTDGAMRFRESMNLRQIQKQRDVEKNLFDAIYPEGT